MRKVLAVLASLLASTAFAQYPDKPIRLVVPFQAGGAVDATSRIVAERLADQLKQPVVVENRVGAGGTIGSAVVAKSPPDGYTLLFAVLGPIGLAPSLYSKLPYDVATDFAPVALIASYPNTLLISKSAPFKSVKELIAAAKANPGGISYATGGSGTILHLSAELFSKMAGIKMTHIPYKGGLAAMPDLIAGRVPVLFANIALAVPYTHSDKVAVLATTGTAKSRFALLPGVPTLAEVADLKGYETYDWFGILAPAGTPAPIVAQLNRSVTQLQENPEVRKKLVDQGAQIEARTPAEFGEFIKSEIAKWAEVIKFSGAKLD